METGRSIYQIPTKAPMNSVEWNPKYNLLAYAGDDKNKYQNDEGMSEIRYNILAYIELSKDQIQFGKILRGSNCSNLIRVPGSESKSISIVRWISDLGPIWNLVSKNSKIYTSSKTPLIFVSLTTKRETMQNRFFLFCNFIS